MHGVAAAIKQPSRGKPAWGKILRLDLAMLSMQDGNGASSQRRQRGVNERAQIVRMNHRRPLLPDHSRQGQQAAQGETGLLA